MKNHRYHAVLVSILLIFIPLFLSAQELPVLGILPFESTDIQDDERQTIEYLIQSYVSRLEMFRLVRDSDRDKVLEELEFTLKSTDGTYTKAGELLAADYLLSGAIGSLEDNWVLTLEVLKVKTGEKKSVSNVYKSMSELALDSHVLVRQLFANKALASESPEVQSVRPIEPESLYGLWQGDSGVEYVRILTGNRALAILSSGAQMELSYRIDGTQVVFTQTSANNLRYFYPAPYAIAVQLVEIAEPVRWEFSLSEDGKSLSGTKFGTAVRYERDTILEVYRGRSREAEWNKTTR